MSKHIFAVLLDCGHVGASKSLQVKLFIIAENCVEAFSMACRMPRVKRKTNKSGVLEVKGVSTDEYKNGLKEQNPFFLEYLERRKAN